jgi:glycyl-tRNA synthetase beta subunit
LKWDKNKTYFFRPIEVIVTLSDNQKVIFAGRSLDSLSSSFLCGKSKALTTHGKVLIQGFENHKGNKERLSGILAYASNYDQEKTVKKIIFSK